MLAGLNAGILSYHHGTAAFAAGGFRFPFGFGRNPVSARTSTGIGFRVRPGAFWTGAGRKPPPGRLWALRGPPGLVPGWAFGFRLVGAFAGIWEARGFAVGIAMRVFITHRATVLKWYDTTTLKR